MWMKKKKLFSSFITLESHCWGSTISEFCCLFFFAWLNFFFHYYRLALLCLFFHCMSAHFSTSDLGWLVFYSILCRIFFSARNLNMMKNCTQKVKEILSCKKRRIIQLLLFFWDGQESFFVSLFICGFWTLWAFGGWIGVGGIPKFCGEFKRFLKAVGFWNWWNTLGALFKKFFEGFEFFHGKFFRNSMKCSDFCGC